jgi:predicted transposase YdaD
MTLAQQLKQEGLQQDRHEGELSLAKKLLNRGIDLDLIKSASGFSEQELLELEES